MTTNTLALRPIGYRFVEDGVVPLYSMDPEVEGIMSNVKSGLAAKMVNQLFAIRMIRATPKKEAEGKAASKQ